MPRSHIALFLRLLVLSAFIAAPAVAQDAPAPELVTDRPDQTESSDIIPFGWFQFEIGLAHEEAGDTPSDTVAWQLEASPRGLAVKGAW